jgi:predicted nicotinamide N-methyase
MADLRVSEHRVVAGLRLTWREFSAPVPNGASADDSRAAFGVWVPDDPDALLDELTQEEFERSDERMPYFATIWESAESLVAHVLAGSRLDDQHVLDLGCGLGLCGFAAASRGAHVTFFDWEPRALEIVAASARTQGLRPGTLELVVGDWRMPPPMGPFDLILGADVVYERRNAPPVAAFLGSALKPGADAWVTDPGRPQAEAFAACIEQAGLQLLDRYLLPPQPHGVDIVLYGIRRPD